MQNRIDKIKEIIENNKNSLVGPMDMINPISDRAEKELAEQRYSICNECPELIKLTKQCKKCGCFMLAKTKLQLSTCPLGKW
jgi:hypothetical protein